MQPVPEAPKPIDYDKMANASIRVAKESLAAEEEAVKRLYPQYIGMQFDTADKLSKNLDNQYLNTYRQAISGEMARYSGPSGLENQLATLGANSMAVRPDQVSGARVADVKQMQAAQAGPVANVQSQGIDASAAERALMREATGGGLLGQLQSQAARDLSLGRSLSAEQERAATQQARSGMAARGLGAGTGALAAEVLNRDAYATQSENARRAFASGVLNQGTGLQQAANQAFMGRMEGNRSRELQSALSNQQTALSLGLTNAQLAQSANAANFEGAQQRAMADAGYAQQAALANQAANQDQVNANRAFLQNVNQTLIGNEAARSQQRLGLAGLYGDLDPYRAAIGPAFGLGSTTLGQTSGQVRDIYGGSLAMAGNVESFNKNMAATDRNTILNNNAALKAASITGSASNNAGWMSMLGGLAQGAGSVGGGYLAGKSDRREKTAIKKIGKDPLGLNTYEYKYKGDDRTRTGPMAQDVRKVLPEAVEEVEIKGKKRLAIRPKVLGQAYADAIAAEQDIMFPDGYVVGSGKA